MPAWQQLWGEKSQARRFKDGAIVHAVVWEAAPEARHGVPLQIVRHLMERHHALPPPRVRCALHACDALLAAPSCGLSQTTASAIVRAFDAMSGAMRGLQAGRCRRHHHVHHHHCLHLEHPTSCIAASTSITTSMT